MAASNTQEIIQLTKTIKETIERTKGADAPEINFILKAKNGIEKSNERLGVFPASFDPLTRAHVAIIKEGRKYKLKEILLLLDIKHADSKDFSFSLEERALLISLFFKRYKYISVGISSHSLFLEKLEALKRLYPQVTKIYFLVGYDTLVRVLNRKYYQDRDAALTELFSRSQFLVAGRESKREKDIYALLDKETNQRFKKQVKTLDIGPLAYISATEVRERLKQGKGIEDLVPEEGLFLLRKISRRQP